MKKILRKIICLFLITTVLVSTSGAVIHKHFCPISGKTDVSFEKESHCCGSAKTNETCIKEDFTNKNNNYKQVPDDQFNTINFSEENNGCCEIEQQELTADFLVSSCSFEFKSNYHINIDLRVYSTLINSDHSEYLEKPSFYFPPPPKSGKLITIHNQVFQI